jgi:hypothetical protein
MNNSPALSNKTQDYGWTYNGDDVDEPCDKSNAHLQPNGDRNISGRIWNLFSNMAVRNTISIEVYNCKREYDPTLQRPVYRPSMRR